MKVPGGSIINNRSPKVMRLPSNYLVHAKTRKVFQVTENKNMSSSPFPFGSPHPPLMMTIKGMTSCFARERRKVANFLTKNDLRISDAGMSGARNAIRYCKQRAQMVDHEGYQGSCRTALGRHEASY